MFKLLHDFLRWFPLAVFGGAIALATAFKPIADWLAAKFPIWAQSRNDPLIAALVLAALAIYVGLLLWTGRQASKDRPRFKGQIINVIHGGQGLGHDFQALLVEAQIANVGTMPSIAPVADWRLAIKPRRQPEVTVPMLVQEGVIDLGVGANRVVYQPDQAIFTRMREPLAVGDAETGYAFAPLTAQQYALLERGAQVRLYYSDVLGNKYCIRYKWVGGRSEEPSMPLAGKIMPNVR